MALEGDHITDARKELAIDDLINFCKRVTDPSYAFLE